MSIMDKLFLKVSAWLPSRLVYWCAIRVASHATTGKYSSQIVPDLTAMDAIQRWEEKFEAAK